jgi:gliding motility-associatede transport system auxiliary component
MAVTHGSGKYIKLVLYLVIIVLINLAGITAFFRVDLTQDDIYSISEASKKVVSTLSEPLTVNVFFTKNLPAPHNQTERYLHDLLEEYAVHANNHFNYRFYNVNPEAEGVDQKATENRKLADNYGIHPIQIQLIEKDQVQFKRAYMGLVIIHGDLIERIPTITSTEELEYKLTTAVQKLNNKISAFLSLSGNIRVDLFLSSSLEAVAPLMGLEGLSELPRELERVVEKLNDKMYGKLQYHHFDPTKDSSIESELGKYHLMSLQWPALSGGKIKAGRGVAGLVMAYDKKVVEIPLINVMRIPIIGTRYDLMDMDQIEEDIDTGVEKLIDINEDLGYLEDHGTPALQSSRPMGNRNPEQLSAFSQLVSENYTIKPVQLTSDGIPEGLSCLVIAGPSEPFSDYDLYRIDQALMRGTNLAVFPDTFKEVRPSGQQAMGFQQPQYVPLNIGLEKLLNHYGIHIKKSWVMDENCYRQRVSRQFGGGERPIYYAPIIQNRFIDNSLDFMDNIKGLVALKISPLELDKKRLSDQGVKATPLFSSSEKSWEMADRITANPMFIRPPQSDDEKKSLALAYLLEGEFTSYFSGKPIPEQPAKTSEGEGEAAGPDALSKDDVPGEPVSSEVSKIEDLGSRRDKGKSARILVVASSEMIKDNILDSEGKGPNTMFILNAIDSLNNREEIAVMRSKDLRFNPLYETDAFTKMFIKAINIAGVPAFAVIFGFFVLLRRRARKKRIQVLFHK